MTAQTTYWDLSSGGFLRTTITSQNTENATTPAMVARARIGDRSAFMRAPVCGAG